MNKDQKIGLTALGSGLAAGAAGYGASSAMGGDQGTALTSGIAVGLTSAALAHLIAKKVNDNPPLASPMLAGSASAFAGTGTALGSLGALSVLEEGINNSKGLEKGINRYNAFIKGLGRNTLGGGAPKSKVMQAVGTAVRGIDDPLRKLYNSYKNAESTLGKASNIAAPGNGKPIRMPSTNAKILGALLRNKKSALAGMLGVATVPAVYQLLRGNGSD